MANQCPICGACNADEICFDGQKYEAGCPIQAEIDELQAEDDAKRAAQVRAGIMLPTDGNRDGVYSNGGPMITDHAHDAGSNPSSRCYCGLAAAAHAKSATPHGFSHSYRCPDCVTTGKATCGHPRTGEVAIP